MLFQREKLTSLEYYIIYNNKCNKTDRFYLINKKSGKTYSSEIQYKVFTPRDKH